MGVILASKPQSVTSIGVSPEEDRRSRIVKYSVAQGIRVICIVLAVAGAGNWLTYVAGFGAAILPYVAVVVANAADGSSSKAAPKVEAPTIAIAADAFRNASSGN